MCFESPLPKDALESQVCGRPHSKNREQCVIQIHDAWARFCRELVLQSAAEVPTTLSGTIVARAPGINSRADVLPLLRSTYKGKIAKSKDWEPKWAIATQCIDAIFRLNLANRANLSAAIGISPSPLEDLRQVRNFIAHRSMETSLKVQNVATNLGLARPATADDLLISLVPPGVTVFRSWVHDLETIAQLAVA